MVHGVASALQRALSNYFIDSKHLISKPTSPKALFQLVSPLRLVSLFSVLAYILVQGIFVLLFKPPPPKSPEKPLVRPRGHIAVIGTGVTGISSAAHARAHGFEVTIFESKPAPPHRGLGGIWAHVNTSSALQINSLLYRFFPSVIWSGTFPKRDEILESVEQIWKEYGLEPRTKFDTKVTSVRRIAVNQKAREEDSCQGDDTHLSQWIVNDDQSRIYDAVIVCIGTCGAPKVIKLDGMPDEFDWSNLDNDTSSSGEASEADGDDDVKQGQKDSFTQPIIHSSALDTLKPEKLRKFKNIVVVGSGASGVEACETLLGKLKEGAGSEEDKKEETKITMIARSDKWFIPRNVIVDTLIACQPFGREMPLSFILEFLLRKIHYRGVERLAPKDKGLFEGTPVVNDEFLTHVKNGSIAYIQGSPHKLTSSGYVSVKLRSGSDKDSERVPADLMIMATGFERPSLDFISADDGEEIFPKGYQRPNLYLQNFSTQDWSILLTNSSFQNAIGTVGHFHIGIYARILFTLLLDARARPSPKDMKLWVDVIEYVKRGATGGAFSFFTYAELTVWFIMFHLFRPDRLKWMFFIMQGWGVGPQ